MLQTQTFWGVINKEEIAIERLRTFAPVTGTYYLAFSGGKDSIVIWHLANRSGVKFEAYHNITSIDAPEVVRLCREYGCIMTPPKMSMAQLIRKMGLPTRRIRFCCRVLKEQGGSGRTVILGVRWKESSKRRLRKMVEFGKNKNFVNPIIDWTSEDVWEYIKKYNLKYPSLYDKGWKRIGCIGCPMANRIVQFKQFPSFEKIWKENAKIYWEIHHKNWKIDYKTFERWWDWWMSDLPVEDENQCLLPFED